MANASVGLQETTDGRRAWRERNRNAVVDALLDLYEEGVVSPSADDIAAHSGISRRSLFRYFDDMDDLCRVAIARHSDRVSHLFRIDALCEGGLGKRSDALVQQRTRLFEAVAPVARVARMRSLLQPIIAEQLKADGALLRRQLERHLEPELRHLDPQARRRTLVAADVLTSFESYDLLTRCLSLSPEEAGAVMRHGLNALLARRGS